MTLIGGNHLPAALADATKRSKASGGWSQLPHFGAHFGVAQAANHMIAVQQGTAGQPEFQKHNVTGARIQVVAGANYQIAMTAEHVATGELHEIDGTVHRDRSGHHYMKYLGNPRCRP